MNIKLSDEDPTACFVVQDQRDAQNKRVDLCILPLALKPSDSLVSARDKWISDVRMFKEKCKEKEKYIQVETPEIHQKKLEVELEEAEQSYQRVREKTEENKEKSLEGTVEKTAQIAMKVYDYFI